MKKTHCESNRFLYGAGNEARTRYLHLGKVALYRMSYARIGKGYHTTNPNIVKQIFPNPNLEDLDQHRMKKSLCPRRAGGILHIRENIGKRVPT